MGKIKAYVCVRLCVLWVRGLLVDCEIRGANATLDAFICWRVCVNEKLAYVCGVIMSV